MKSLKSTSLAMAIVSVGLLVGGSGNSGRKPGRLPESSPSKIVTGEVAQGRGEFHMAKDPQGELTLDIVDKSYVITSQAGEEVRLELDDNTKVRKRVQPRDKIVGQDLVQRPYHFRSRASSHNSRGPPKESTSMPIQAHMDVGPAVNRHDAGPSRLTASGSAPGAKARMVVRWARHALGELQRQKEDRC